MSDNEKGYYDDISIEIDDEFARPQTQKILLGRRGYSDFN